MPIVPNSSLDLVTIVMVTFNSADILQKSLPGLKNFPRVAIVDNASNDDTLAVAKKLLPQARLYANRRNQGFGRANNLALNDVATPFALVLNPDCSLTEEAVNILVATAQLYPDAAILSPKLYKADGSPEICYRQPFFARTSKDIYADPAGDVCTSFLSGASMFMRMDLMRQVGFFDPAIFLYYEDDDLCLRVRARGLALVLVHDARIVHLSGQSSKPSLSLLFRKHYYGAISHLYVQRKYQAGGRYYSLLIRYLLRDFLRIPLLALTFRGEKIVKAAGHVCAALSALKRAATPGQYNGNQ